MAFLDKHKTIERNATLLLVLSLLVVAIGAGCSARQAYDSAQGWQRNACNRIVDAIERERCIASATTSYDDYHRQRTAPDTPAK